MATFPLEHYPHESYHEAPRVFGCRRANGTRSHAGCDLYAPPGTPVLAVAAGRVIRGPYLFYDVVQALEVEHPCIGVVRYGEISQAAEGVKPGVEVAEGQVIGYVGKMKTVAQSMLHFELYTGKTNGPLTDRNRPPYMRRADLVDPAPFLDSCKLKGS